MKHPAKILLSLDFALSYELCKRSTSLASCAPASRNRIDILKPQHRRDGDDLIASVYEDQVHQKTRSAPILSYYHLISFTQGRMILTYD